MARPKPVARLAVGLRFDGEDIPVGTLAWSREHRSAAFEFAADFAARSLAISPIHLKLGPNVRIAPSSPFGGLFGVFADSLPDGWGRLLLDRKIRAIGGDPGALTPIDRLAFVGTRGMGALVYRPEERLVPDGDSRFDIDDLASAAASIHAGGANDAGVTRDVERLLGANGGSAGARPKILVLRDKETGALALDTGLSDAARQDAWLVKFKTSADPMDIGRIEHAIALTAKAAGISFPETMTIVGASGNAHFAVRRFDRDNGRRFHVLTLAGLLDADFRQASVDYEGFLKATRFLTGRAGDVEEAFRRAVFNVMVSNRDDHPKNHAFMMGSQGEWRLTPAYDVTPSEGPGGEHSMAICGEGRQPGRSDIMRLAQTASIRSAAADAIVDQVESAVAAFREHAERAALDEPTIGTLTTQFDAIRDRFRERPGGSSPDPRSSSSRAKSTSRVR